MGFNKRYIKISNLLSMYCYDGINGVLNYIVKPDALIVSMSDNSRYIVSAITRGDLEGAELIIKYELSNVQN
jgi:uncharacterized protein (UPF0297 family)